MDVRVLHDAVGRYGKQRFARDRQIGRHDLTRPRRLAGRGRHARAANQWAGRGRLVGDNLAGLAVEHHHATLRGHVDLLVANGRSSRDLERH